MSSFTNTPAIKQLPDGIRWVTMEDFEYHVGSEDSNDVIRVPKGTVSDGASIPRFLWRVVGHPWGSYAYAAILHDYLCNLEGYPRKKADYVFYEAMGVLGVSWFKKTIMYLAVRLWHKFK